MKKCPLCKLWSVDEYEFGSYKCYTAGCTYIRHADDSYSYLQHEGDIAKRVRVDKTGTKTTIRIIEKRI